MLNIGPIELREKLENGQKPLLLDVREDWEYELCRIEGSCHIPMMLIADKLAELDQSNETVVICHHGMRSLQVAHYLESIGFENVINLDGGLDAWAKIVDPDMSQY